MTQPLPAVDVLGFWIGIFLTFSILSYLYKDNPFYKLAEHVFVGTSIGYVITQQYYNVIKPTLLANLEDRGPWWRYLFNPYNLTLILVILLFSKAFSRRVAWLGRYPLAFVVALYAGLQVNAVGNSDLAEQIKVSMRPLKAPRVDLNDPRTTMEDMSTLPGFSPPVAKLVAEARARGARFASLDEVERVPGLTPEQRADLHEARGSITGLDAQAGTRPAGDYSYWFGVLSKLLLLVGLLASLWYFYFSIEQRGPLKKVATFGVWVLMIGFGASFGYTVQGRLALAVGRAMDMLDKNKPAEVAARVHGPTVSVISMVAILVGIIYWEKVWKPRHDARRGDAAGAGGGGGGGPDHDLPAY
jgi:hypothetical protein